MPIPMYPTYSGIEGQGKFPPDELVWDETGRIRFVNVRTIGEAASPQKGMRILRGIITTAKPAPAIISARKKIIEEWQWEATGFQLHDFYVWTTIILHPPEDIPHSGVFTKDRLENLALQVDSLNGKPLTLVEQIAHFMVGCLTAFGTRYQAAIAEDMTFVPPVEKCEE